MYFYRISVDIGVNKHAPLQYDVHAYSRNHAIRYAKDRASSYIDWLMKFAPDLGKQAVTMFVTVEDGWKLS